jgi:hypothetical protein
MDLRILRERGGRRPRVPDDFLWMGVQAAGDLDGFPDSVRWPPTHRSRGL